jgi:hypothetical protein
MVKLKVHVDFVAAAADGVARLALASACGGRALVNARPWTATRGGANAGVGGA